MEHILTLVAAAGTTLTEDMATATRDALKGLGAVAAPADWLSPGRAVDIAFDHLAPEQADAAARFRLGAAPIDVFAQPSERRRKTLLVADMDSTMVIGETLDELAEYAGIKDKIAAITARAMNGEIGFEGALRERIGLLDGLPEQALEQTWANTRMMPGAIALVRTMKAHGAHTVLVSGGFTFFTSRVAAICGFDAHLGNRFIFKDGALRGVEDPILGREAKLATLKATAGERQIPLALAAAVGDGANDLDMLKAAGLGVAYHAKPIVAEQARMRVDHGDLTAMLYAQGFRDSDMVEG